MFCCAKWMACPVNKLHVFCSPWPKWKPCARFRYFSRKERPLQWDYGLCYRSTPAPHPLLLCRGQGEASEALGVGTSKVGSSLLFTLHETNAGQLKEGIGTLPGLGLSLHRFFQQLQALEEWISLWIVTINYLSILQNAALSSLFADFSTNRTSQLSTLLGNFLHYWKKLYNTLFCSNKNEPPGNRYLPLGKVRKKTLPLSLAIDEKKTNLEVVFSWTHLPFSFSAWSN